MTRSLAECADIVAELANRREPLWEDRLRRPVSYEREKLKEIAVAAARVAVLGDEAVMDVIQSGIQSHEIGWQIEWSARTHVAGHA